MTQDHNSEQATVEYAAAPVTVTPTQVRLLRPKPLIVRLITEHNPFYLLSATCMLASCLALTNSLSWSPIPMRRLVMLVVTLNVYEAALIAIALFLVTRRRLQRDGRMLLVLQAFFVADFSFLNAEIATSSPRPEVGMLLNMILFALAVLKLWVVMQVLQPNFTPVQFIFMAMQLAVLFAVPCALRLMDAQKGTVGPRHLYAMWWLTALLPALYELLVRVDPHRPALLAAIGWGNPVRPGDAAPTRSYLALPYLSLLTHLGILHYVYDVRFFGAHAAPLMLGLALALNRYNPPLRWIGLKLSVTKFLLPLGAVFVSTNNPFYFQLGSGYPRLTLSPLNLAVAGAFVTYVYCYLLPHARLFLAVGAGMAAVYVFGPSREQIWGIGHSAGQWAVGSAQKLMPKTLAHWGLVGLFFAFGFLGAGFWVSLKKPPQDEPDGVPAPPNA